MITQNNETDLDIVKDLLNRYIHLDTISLLYLCEFQDRAKWHVKDGEEPRLGTVISRFRRALNEATKLKLCIKKSMGSSAYQTSDTLGGKSYNAYTEIKFYNSENNI